MSINPCHGMWMEPSSTIGKYGLKAISPGMAIGICEVTGEAAPVGVLGDSSQRAGWGPSQEPVHRS